MAEIKIALVGNPNCGKTTLFNELTGSNQYVGNWPGVTVEKKDGRLKKNTEVIVQDLPGVYSLSPYSLDEVVTRSYLVDEKPDVILNIIDGTNLERNLYLTTQLLELGIPMLIAINMLDVVRRNGDEIHFEKLANELKCPVLGISAVRGEGIDEVIERATNLAREGEALSHPHVFTGSVEHALAHIEESIQGMVDDAELRWFTIKIFERDRKATSRLLIEANLAKHLEEHIAECEREMEDDAESIITNQRYAWVKEIFEFCVKKKKRPGSLSFSDKIDRVVTNRFWSLPIFAVIVWFMYYIAVTTLGGWLTDWMSEGVFGKGWFVWRTKDVPVFCSEAVNQLNRDLRAKGMSLETWDEVSQRYEERQKIRNAWIDAYRYRVEGLGKTFDEGKIDETIGRDVTAFVVFEDSVTGEIETEKTRNYGYGDFQAIPREKAPNPRDYGVWVPGLPELFESGFASIGIPPKGLVHRLIFDCVLGGVGSVLCFVPQILIVFLFLSFLEDCGYMARIAFIMDRIFRSFGLSGKSFIPIVIGMGCGVPAVLATRTIESERDRRMTILLTTYLPCSAKYAIIAMFTTAFFDGNSMVATAMYFLGFAIIVLGGIALKKSRIFAGEVTPFLMELPAYHIPSVKGVFIHTWDRVKAYIVKAGTIIFVVCVASWFLMSFSWNCQPADFDHSMLHDIGTWFAWIFAPLGFGHWQGAVATISAELAKEQAVADLAMLAGNSEVIGTAQAIKELFIRMNGEKLASLTGLSFMLMNLFDPPCIVAVITAFKEMGGRKWGWFALGFQFFVGYGLALVVFQLGGLFFYGQRLDVWDIVAMLVVVGVAWSLFRKPKKVAEGGE